MAKAPQVTLRAMERARSTLEDFCRSYFMFHGMNEESPAHVFKYLPMLMFVEAYIYQLDEENEAGIQKSKRTENVFEHESAADVNLLGDDPFMTLRQDLIGRNLLTDRIEKELEDGVEYWQLERSLCHALSNDLEISIADVMKAIRLKSFDYRVLNLLLYQLREQQVDEVHLSFLTASELLVEISDDLYDYEEDVVDNSFNILRMFVKAYGPKRAPVMLAKFISQAEEMYQELFNKLEPGLAGRYQKRCEEAVREGGSKSKHLLGCWTIPHLILDEAAYRSQTMESSNEEMN